MVLKTEGVYDGWFEAACSQRDVKEFKDFFESQLHEVELEEAKNQTGEIDSVSQL